MPEDTKKTPDTSDASSSPTSRRAGAAPKTARSNAPKPPKGDDAKKSDETAAADKAREAKRAERAKKEQATKDAEQKSVRRFDYSGPKSSITFGSGREVPMDPGTVVELPADHKYTKALLERGYIKPVAEDASKPREGAGKDGG